MNAQSALTGLLVVQTVLAVWAWYPRSTGVEPRQLVPFERSAIQKIQLESVSTRNRGGDLVLARDGDGWTIQSHFNFPAQSEPVEEILDRLMNLKIGRPISSDPSMHRQLNVTEQNLTRRVTLHTADDSFSFIAGTATRERMHVRFPDEDDVYVTHGLGAWRMSDSTRVYLPKDALVTPIEDVVAFQLTNPAGTLALTRSDTGWDLPDGPARSEEARTFVQQVTNLKISDPADLSAPDPREEPEVTVSWTLQDGTSGSYHGRRHNGTLIIRLGDDSLPLFKVSSVDPQPQLLETTGASLAAEPLGVEPE